MINKIQDTIKKHKMLDNCKNIVVGVSGGSDSMTLLLSLKNIIQFSFPNIHLWAAHVNHMIRGENSDRDEAYVFDICKELGIPLHIKRCDAGKLAQMQKISVEMSGRNIRYEFFNDIAQNLDECKIAVAHNFDDRAETVLLNIIRGTGLAGLKGIPYKRGNIIRPLLDIKKAEINEYCLSNKIHVCEDESNCEEIYRRNRVRLSLIPYINDVFQTDISDRLIRLTNNIIPIEEYLKESAEDAMTNCCDDKDGIKVLDVESFNNLHYALKIYILNDICSGNLESVHFDKLVEFISYAKTGKIFELPGELIGEKSYKKVLFKPKYKENIGLFEFTLGENICIDELSVKLLCRKHEYDEKYNKKNAKIENLSFKQVFDYDRIKNGVIRNRRAGDLFFPYKGAGKKKLNDFFTDIKVPIHNRDEKILLAVGKEIVWIAGVRIANGFLPDENTKTVIEIKVEKIRKDKK